MKKCFVYFLFVSIFCYSQEPSYIHLTEKDGLPDIEFYDIHKDNKGYIWLAADLGIFKYDGKNYLNYTHPEKRGLSLFNLYEDKDGRIWCNNISGQIFYIEDDTMFLFADEQTKKHGNQIDILVQNGYVYISNAYTFAIYEFSSKQLIKTIDKYLFDSPSVYFNDQILAIRDSTLYNFKSDFSKIGLLTDLNLKSKRYVNRFFTTEKELFIYRGLDTFEFFRLDMGKNALIPVRLPEELAKSRWSSIQQIDESLWFSTDKGTFKCLLNNDEIIIQQLFFEGIYTTGIAKDIDQNYWITTLYNGIFVIPNLSVKKIHDSSDNSKVLALSSYKNGAVLFGCLDGSVKSFKPESNTLERLYSNSTKFSDLLYLDARDIIISCNDLSSSLLRDNRSFIINGYNSIKDVAKISEDTIIIATYNQTTLLDITDINYVKEIKTFHQERSYTVHYDSITKTYYSGTISNLKSYDKYYDETIIKLNNNDVFAIDIAQTGNGIVWASTFNQGVIGIHNGQVIEVLDESKGLLSSNSSKLLAHNNYLWITTDKGIVRVDVENYDIKTLTALDGIPSYKIYDIVKNNDHIYVANNEGVFSIDINNAFIERPVPNLNIKEVLINGSAVDWQSNKLKIPIENNSIAVYLSSNGFQTNSSLFYEYRFNDNESWNNLEPGVDVLNFVNLANQEYQLSIRATNKFSGKSSEVKYVNFVIVLPFYKQMWFILMMALLGVLAGILYVRHYFNRKRIQQDEKYSRLHLENQLNALKLENLRSQMNPHFIFNAFNSIQDYILRNKREEASDYLGKFADLVRGYLYSSTDDKIAFHKEIENLEHYLELEKLRFEDDFIFDIKVDKEINQFHFYIPTMLIQPFLENAVKHGLLHKSGIKKIQLHFSLMRDEHSKNEDMLLLCTIKDNGIGRASSRKMKNVSSTHRSFGVIATEKRLELLNSNLKEKVNLEIVDLFTVSGEPNGTEIKLRIPVFWDK